MLSVREKDNRRQPSRARETRIAASYNVILPDIPRYVCNVSIKARVGKHRDDISFISENNCEEFLTRAGSFAEKSLPKIYNLLRDARNKNAIVFRTNEEINECLDHI